MYDSVVILKGEFLIAIRLFIGYRDIGFGKNISDSLCYASSATICFQIPRCHASVQQ